VSQFSRAERVRYVAVHAPLALASARAVQLHLRELGVDVAELDKAIAATEAVLRDLASHAVTGWEPETPEQAAGHERA
jgi:hypothetical protein